MYSVLLTGGASSRMGRPKALLPYKKSTFARTILDAMRHAGIRNICMVVGHDPGPIISSVADLGLRYIYNSRWKKGQLSSIQSAINDIPSTAPGILLTLVDQPGLHHKTFKTMISHIKKNPKNIYVASYKGRRGHPVWFPRHIFKELNAAPDNKGARVVIQNHADIRISVPTLDAAVVQDIDSRRDYIKFK